MAAAFGACNGANAFLWICFAPVVDATARRYGVSATDVNQLSLLFLYLYAPGLLLSAFATERYGLRANVAMGAALNAACAWVRYAATGAPRRSAFGVLAFGQALGAIAQPAFTNTPALLAREWFPPAEREHAVVWTSVSNVLGNAAGSAIPGLIVSRAHEAADLDALLLGQAVACSALLVLTCAVMAAPPAARERAEPEEDEPQATAASSAGADALRSVLRSAWALLHNRAYLPLLTAVAVGVGLSIALLTLVAQLLSPCNYGADVASLAGGALLVAGVIGAGLAGAWLTRWPGSAVRLEQGLVFLLAAALVGVLACLRRGALGPLLATWAALGGALIPLLPVSLQNAAAAAAPAPPDVAAGLMLLAGQWAGVAYVFALPPLMAMRPSAECNTVATPAAAFLLANVLVACAAIAALRPPPPPQAAAVAAGSEEAPAEPGLPLGDA